MPILCKAASTFCSTTISPTPMRWLTSARRCITSSRCRSVSSGRTFVSLTTNPDWAELKTCPVGAAPVTLTTRPALTTDVAVASIDEGTRITTEEIRYLLAAANRFLMKPLAESDVVSTYAAVRPLYDDGSANPSEVTRDFVLKVDHDAFKAPLLTVFGGKITTYRRLAEDAMKQTAH